VAVQADVDAAADAPVADQSARPAGPPAPRNRVAGALVVVSAGGLAGLAYLGQVHGWGLTPLAAGLFVVQAVFALAWVAALDTRGSRGAVLIGVAAAATADAVIAAYPHQGLHVIAAVAGIGLVLALLQQLLRRPRPDVVAALAATTSLILLVLAGASLLALRAVIARSGYAVATGLFGVVAAGLVARLVDAVVRRPPAAPASSRGLLGLLAGVAAAGAAGAEWVTHFHLPVPGAWIGVRIAIVAAVLGLVADLTIDLAGAARLDDRARSALAPLAVLLPVLLAGPAIYVAGRYLLG